MNVNDVLSLVATRKFEKVSEIDGMGYNFDREGELVSEDEEYIVNICKDRIILTDVVKGQTQVFFLAEF